MGIVVYHHWACTYILESNCNLKGKQVPNFKKINKNNCILVSEDNFFFGPGSWHGNNHHGPGAAAVQQHPGWILAVFTKPL